MLNETVQTELEDMPRDIIANFLRLSEMMQIGGPQRLREPYVKHLEGPLWEMRMNGRDAIGRAAYIVVKDRRIVVVHVFVKKTRKTPRRNIDLALKRAKVVMS